MGKQLIWTESDWGVLVLPAGIKNWHMFPGEKDGEQMGESLRHYQTSEEKII